MEPERNVWIYLDSTVLIDLEHAVGGDTLWVPPAEPTPVELRWIAATRLFLYSRRAHPIDGKERYLVVSSIGRAEISANNRLDFTLPMFQSIDGVSDAPPPGEIEKETNRLMSLGLKEMDAGHLARAILTEYIDVFVTDDEKLWKKKDSLSLPEHLSMCGVIEAADDLKIAPGESPPTRFRAGSALASGPFWWIP
jgi:hypothetical protein